LLGGLGADTIKGGAGGDLLAADKTAYDGDLTGLLVLQAEWTGLNDYQTRVRHLNGALAGGADGVNYLTAATVTKDTAVDQLSGEGGQDWFLFSATGKVGDKVTDGASGEFLTGL
jgi:Ca2+-binding RTX toxin-like protein